MQRSLTVRVSTASAPRHPYYGLYVDPHGGRHAWWAVDGRAVAAIASLLGGLAAVLSLLAR